MEIGQVSTVLVLFLECRMKWNYRVEDSWIRRSEQNSYRNCHLFIEPYQETSRAKYIYDTT